MKKIFVAAVFLMLAGKAYAADLPTKAPVNTAPFYNWTGCYVGGNVGGILDKSHFDEPNASPEFKSSNDASSVAGGAQIGCNYMTQNRLVLGVEGDWSAMSLDKASPTAAVGETYRTKWDWSTSVRGRIGYAPDNTLWYITGGPAWAHQSSAQFLGLFPGHPTEPLSATHSGWTIGGGIEHAFTPNWIVGVEYLYAKYGNETYKCSNCGPVKVDNRTNEVRARVSYKF